MSEQDIKSMLKDALYILHRTGKGLEAVLDQDLTSLTIPEQIAIMKNAQINHTMALAVAARTLKEYEMENSDANKPS